ncbi:MAG: hypothetical protein KatS3mg105_0721 [Gemmatales bacterium]|nr:MAG: hypothetical protein KatS3mg105_0721 [Gemmatales bacterium]
MRRILCSLAFVGVLGHVTIVPPILAEEFKLEPGFKFLFNGKDLTGWKLKSDGSSLDGKTEAPKKRFQVIDGKLVIDGKTRGNMIIETAHRFDKDVHIKFEFLPDDKCNNDLYFRGNKFDIKRGDVKNLKPGAWHLFEIIVTGDKVEFKCNGEVQRVGKAKSASPLGIRAEFGAIQFRNIRYKE